MLNKGDLQAIRILMKEEISTALIINNKENNKAILDVVGEMFVANNQKIISAVGEMLEQNIFPQFVEIHGEIAKLKTVAGWQH